jgi:hypothetical protein
MFVVGDSLSSNRRTTCAYVSFREKEARVGKEGEEGEEGVFWFGLAVANWAMVARRYVVCGRCRARGRAHFFCYEGFMFRSAFRRSRKLDLVGAEQNALQIEYGSTCRDADADNANAMDFVSS